MTVLPEDAVYALDTLRSVHAYYAEKVDVGYEQPHTSARVALDVLEEKLRQQAVEIRIREQSQIPVIPRAAQERLTKAEARVQELEDALRDFRDSWLIVREGCDDAHCEESLAKADALLADAQAHEEPPAVCTPTCERCEP